MNARKKKVKPPQLLLELEFQDLKVSVLITRLHWPKQLIGVLRRHSPMLQLRKVTKRAKQKPLQGIESIDFADRLKI